MTEIIDLFVDKESAARFSLFAASSIIGMLFAYINRWAEGDSKATLGIYLWGDKKAVVKAVTALFMLWSGAGGLSYLDGLTGFKILLAGFGIGYLVPQTVDKRGVANVAAANTKSQ
ncbi:MAG: hypothetical protein K2Q13_10125 [Nitrosomonas sp.]|uniref:hypothetical protein n=1 Tax=Nitrosomonas sp. TaxID=42353 RepID=UPI0025CFB88B|nr:hypothetical protein [Nitrosomonas sp.]MBY0475398.1 hypothetical protein [Nitrosomonas sp.]